MVSIICTYIGLLLLCRRCVAEIILPASENNVLLDNTINMIDIMRLGSWGSSGASDW